MFSYQLNKPKDGPMWSVAAQVAATAVTGALTKPKKISAPAPRDYLGEMRSALDAQANIQDQLLSQAGTWTPKYQALQQKIINDQMGVVSDIYGNAIPLSQNLQNQITAGQQGVYKNAANYGNSIYQSSLDQGTKNIYQQMQEQAINDLSAGTALTPDMERQAQQSARAAMTARGLSYGNQGIAAEVLNSYNMGLQRQDRARQYAGSIYGAGLGQQTAAYNQFTSPLMQQASAVSPASLVGTAGQMSAGFGTNLFTPESQYNAGIYGANQSNQMNAAIANAQAQAGWASGLMNMAGNIGGSILRNPNLTSGSFWGGPANSMTPFSGSPAPTPSGWGDNSFTGGSYYGGIGLFKP